MKIGPSSIALLVTVASTFAADPVNFRRDVQPILANHCLTCHGPDAGTRKGGLRLDTREGALAEGQSGSKAIVPGKPEASELLKRITSHEEGEVMPPPKQKNPLPKEKVELLKRWIAEGATYEQHWAFVPPKQPDLSKAGTAHPIDYLVQQRVTAANLKPSVPAPPEMLVRRIHLDLIGLPPSPAEVDTFVKAASENRKQAISKLIDQLQASKQFGVKWARHWLDVARYADSDGYEKDLPRQQWAYRDWVVRAFNADMPFSQFLKEQLAGDLLPNRTQSNLIATGFLRNSMVNEEGAIIAEQFRKEAMFDRLDALGKILGLSLQCAQCHTHKYDPITHQDYYSLFAFLDNTFEAQSWVYSDAKLRTIDDLEFRIRNRLLQAIDKLPNADELQHKWEADRLASQTPWKVLHPSEVIWGGGLCHPDIQPDGSVLNLGHKGVSGQLVTTATIKEPRITGLRLEALTHGDLPFTGPGRSPTGTFAIAEVEVEYALATKGESKWVKLELGQATADVSPPAKPQPVEYRNDQPNKPDTRQVGPASFLTDKKDDTAWMPDLGPGRRNISTHAVIPFAKPLEVPTGSLLRITLKFRHAGNSAFGTMNLFLGRFRLSTTDHAKPLADPYGPKVRDYLKVFHGRRTAEQRFAVLEAWAKTVPELKAVHEELDKLWATYPEATTSVLNVEERPAEFARNTFRLDRGAWDKPKEKLTPNTPAALPSMPASVPRSRLTLADWFTSHENPLTARVQVNRVWQSLWGMGLVETAEEFGTRGSLPSHPELLDHLALEYRRNDWSLKKLLKHILTSETYQQTSNVSAKLLELDPKNTLLSRGARFRPDGEVVRDLVLGASGLLNTDLDGPYIFPPVPEGLLSLSYAKVDFWKTAEGRDRYRRSLYVFRRRSLPDPLLTCFDAPNGDASVARRQRSNTPLAALAALNEPVLVESARAMALRVLASGKTDAERMNFAFKLCTARTPTHQESETLGKLLQETRQRMSEGWVNVREVLTGDPTKLPSLPDGATPTEAATWTIVSRVLLNLDETLTKN